MNKSAHNFSCNGLRLQEAHAFPRPAATTPRSAPSPFIFLTPHLPGFASQVQVQPSEPGETLGRTRFTSSRPCAAMDRAPGDPRSTRWGGPARGASAPGPTPGLDSRPRRPRRAPRRASPARRPVPARPAALPCPGSPAPGALRPGATQQVAAASRRPSPTRAGTSSRGGARVRARSQPRRSLSALGSAGADAFARSQPRASPAPSRSRERRPRARGDALEGLCPAPGAFPPSAQRRCGAAGGPDLRSPGPPEPPTGGSRGASPGAPARPDAAARPRCPEPSRVTGSGSRAGPEGGAGRECASERKHRMALLNRAVPASPGSLGAAACAGDSPLRLRKCGRGGAEDSPPRGAPSPSAARRSRETAL